jgi:hypothetical protein
MNCKPGDLAYIVAPWIEEGRGRFVHVVRAATADDLRAVGIYSAPTFHIWFCRGDIVTWDGPRREFVIADESLRPIRPGAISDEQVRDLYLPKVPEAA